MSETPRFTFMLTDAAGGATKRIPLAKTGSFVKGDKKFSITAQTLRDIVEHFSKAKADTVIDYEHASEQPEVAAGGPVPAAGWLKAIDQQPDANGVLWGTAEFTPRATELIDNKEYKYISPVIVWNKRDKQTGAPIDGATLTSVALTNRPFLDSMPAIAMSDGWAEEFDRGDAAKVAKEKIVKVILADRVARTVRVVNDENVETTMQVEGLEAPPTVIRLSDVPRGGDGMFTFAALNLSAGTLIASEVFVAREVQTELDAVIGKGLITPAQRPFYEKMALSDLTSFRDLVKTMKPVVDLKERGIGGGTTAGGAVTAETELLAAVDQKLKDNKGMPYSQALKLVASENPELNRRYTKFTRERSNNGGEE